MSNVTTEIRTAIATALTAGDSLRKISRDLNIGRSVVTRISKEIAAEAKNSEVEATVAVEKAEPSKSLFADSDAAIEAAPETVTEEVTETETVAEEEPKKAKKESKAKKTEKPAKAKKEAAPKVKKETASSRARDAFNAVMTAKGEEATYAELFAAVATAAGHTAKGPTNRALKTFAKEAGVDLTKLSDTIEAK